MQESEQGQAQPWNCREYDSAMQCSDSAVLRDKFQLSGEEELHAAPGATGALQITDVVTYRDITKSSRSTASFLRIAFKAVPCPRTDNALAVCAANRAPMVATSSSTDTVATMEIHRGTLKQSLSTARRMERLA